MEPTFQLTPESARALALRLFSKEQFQADPKGCIIRALDWLDRAACDAAPAQSPTPQGNPLIARLDLIVRERGPDTVAKGIGVSMGALKSWLHGVQPNPANLEKVKEYLEGSQTPLSDAVGAVKPSELGQPQEPQPKS
jgi:hypothetical protein